MSGLGETLGLAAVGAVINKRTIKPVVRNQNNKSKKESSNTRDIYSSNNTRAVRDDYEKKARARFRASRDFKQTKVIPKDYKGLDAFYARTKHQVAKIERFDNNNADDDDSVFSDDDNATFDSNYSNGSDEGYHGFSDAGAMLDKIHSISNNRKFESCVAKKNDSKGRDKFREKNTWVQQYDQMRYDNPDGFVSENSSNKHTIGPNARMARIELERQMEIDGGFSSYDKHDDGTYGVVSADSPDFIHENMAPFVRKGPNPIHENKRNMVNQRKLELFTGSDDNPEWRPKIERAPLFSPLIGAVNIYGEPVRTDEYQSRYFAGNERRNELPFQQIKVTP